MNRTLPDKKILNTRELEFAVFCIENIGIYLGISGSEVYHLLAEKSNILNGYIIPCYDVLHSQSKEYIIEDIISLMKKKGLLI